MTRLAHVPSALHSAFALALLASAGSATLQNAPPDQVFLQEFVTADVPIKFAAVGVSVELGPDRLVTGGIGGKGRVYVFDRRPDGAWEQEDLLLSSGGHPESRFGSSLSMDGDRLAIGAVYEDSSGVSSSGAAYIFERTPSGGWVEVVRLESPTSAAGGFFGQSIALEGDEVLVGAPGETVNTITDAGAIHVYRRAGDGTWTHVQRLTRPGASSPAFFGGALDREGDLAAAGSALDEDDQGDRSGSAQVLARQSDGTWTVGPTLFAADSDNADEFGGALALSGETLVIGARRDDEVGTDSGAAYIFERDGAGQWLQIEKLLDEASTFEGFGSAVALDGDLAVIGDPREWGKTTTTGEVSFYRRTAPGTWELLVRVVDEPNGPDWFGASIAIHGLDVAVGATLDDTPGAGVQDSGAVDVLRLCLDCATSVGSGTPGCQGPHGFATATAPVIGWQGFAIETTAVPPNGPGLVLLANALDPAGADPLQLGATFHVDLLASSVLVVFPVVAGADGSSSLPLAIPPDAGLAGTSLALQSVWSWTECSPGPLGLSTSPGLELTVQGH